MTKLISFVKLNDSELSSDESYCILAGVSKDRTHCLAKIVAFPDSKKAVINKTGFTVKGSDANNAIEAAVNYIKNLYDQNEYNILEF